EFCLQPFGDRRELRLRLRAADARLHANESLDPAGAAIFEFVATWIQHLLHRRRHPELKLVADERAVEIFRRDADNRVRDPVEADRAPDRLWILRELALPELIADDNDRMRVPPDVLPRLEATAKDRLYAERVEIVR